MLTKYTDLEKHPLITDVLENLYKDSAFSLMKGEPKSVVKVGSWVYMNPETDLTIDSELDLIVVSSDPNQREEDETVRIKNHMNQVDISLINIGDITARVYEWDIDSVERVSSMSMPSNVIVDDGTYARLNEIYFNRLIPKFYEFCRQNLSEIEDKKSLVRVEYEELVLFPLMMDVYRTCGLAESIDRFFYSDIYSKYIDEYSDKILDLCLREGITCDKDSLYLLLEPEKTDNKDFNPEQYLRRGIPRLKNILIKEYNSLGNHSNVVEEIQQSNKKYHTFLKKEGLLEIPHFEKTGKKMYNFKTQIDEFIF
jgi:hypothetical protein